MSAAGLSATQYHAPALKHPTAFNVYAVAENSPVTRFFFLRQTGQTAQRLTRRGKPYGDKGFIVFRKAGDGAILLPKQFNNTNFIGQVTNAVRSRVDSILLSAPLLSAKRRCVDMQVIALARGKMHRR